MIDVGPIHFLRPAWLAALLALPVLAWWWRRAVATCSDWQRAVDPHLLPYLLEPGAGARRRGIATLAMLAFASTTIALAGPSWRQVEQPAWQARLPLVVAVDLSSASLATDVAPSRQAQLRARLDLLLRQHRDGPVALVAFADDAFTVAPLTDDAANVALFVDALQPDVMPVDGQSPARAIEWSRQLIERADYPRGRIVLVTDHADAAAQRAATAAREAGQVVSVLGLGAPSGAQVRTPGGGVVRVALDEASLRALAQAGGGRYARLSLEGRDAAVFATDAAGAAQGGNTGARTWADEGFRLVPIVMLLALVLLARRPRVAAAVLALALLPWPSLAGDLWLRPDQRAHRAVAAGVDLYRRGDFGAAADAFAHSDTADAHYDRGNALAKAGRLDDAIRAYDAALARQPGMPDAAANRRAVMQALQRRQQGKGDQSGKDGDTSKQSQQTRDCTQGDAACRSPSSPQPPSTRGKSTPPQAKPQPGPADLRRQAQADAAQRERMQRALQQPPNPQAQARMTPAQRERKLSDDAALARVPDEPGSLLREKFRIEHERRRAGEVPR